MYKIVNTKTITKHVAQKLENWYMLSTIKIIKYPVPELELDYCPECRKISTISHSFEFLVINEEEIIVLKLILKTSENH